MTELDRKYFIRRRPEQERGRLGQLRKTLLDHLHIGPAPITLAHRYSARPGEHGVIRILLIEHVMICPGLFLAHSADRCSGWTMLREHLMPAHKKRADQRSVPGHPGPRRC